MRKRVMKRFGLSCLVLLLLFGCSSSEYGLKCYEVSKDEELMAELADSDALWNFFLEFDSAENIGMILVKYYHLELGKWVEDDRHELVLDGQEGTAGKIGFAIKEDADIECYIRIGDASYRYDIELESFFQPVATSSVFFEEETKIVLNQEVPIGIIQYALDGKLADLPLNFFENPQELDSLSHHIEAITINFVQPK